MLHADSIPVPPFKRNSNRLSVIMLWRSIIESMIPINENNSIRFRFSLYSYSHEAVSIAPILSSISSCTALSVSDKSSLLSYSRIGLIKFGGQSIRAVFNSSSNNIVPFLFELSNVVQLSQMSPLSTTPFRIFCIVLWLLLGELQSDALASIACSRHLCRRNNSLNPPESDFSVIISSSLVNISWRLD